MSETVIRRRSLPDSLRYLADKLESDALSDAERAGVITSLRALADEAAPDTDSTTPESAPVDDGLCHATITSPWEGERSCVHEAGHYDETNEPDFLGSEQPDPGGWHQSAPDADGVRTTWSDRADDATPHRAGPVRPDEEPT
jgi:hypothetical protein